MEKVKIVENILPNNILNYVYQVIINEPIWTLSTKSQNTEFTIAGNNLFDKHRNINTKSNSQILASMIYMCIKDKVDFLTNDIHRIHIGAKANLQDDNLHIDSIENCYTVLFYLNPYWNKEWGGETIVGNEKIQYKPNRALIYDSKILHGGMGPKSPHLRTYINYVVGKNNL